MLNRTFCFLVNLFSKSSLQHQVDKFARGSTVHLPQKSSDYLSKESEILRTRALCLEEIDYLSQKSSDYLSKESEMLRPRAPLRSEETGHSISRSVHFIYLFLYNKFLSMTLVFNGYECS